MKEPIVQINGFCPGCDLPYHIKKRYGWNPDDMDLLKCPRCGKVFQVRDVETPDYAELGGGD